MINFFDKGQFPQEDLDDLMKFKSDSREFMEIKTEHYLLGENFSLLFKKKKKLRFLKVYIKSRPLVNLSPGAINTIPLKELPHEIRIVEENYYNKNYDKNIVFKTEVYSEEYL